MSRKKLFVVLSCAIFLACALVLTFSHVTSPSTNVHAAGVGRCVDRCTPGKPKPASVCPPLVGYGSTGYWVKVLQETLNSKEGASLVVDGIFGARTKQAVSSWQRSHGLSADGIAGPITWHSLNYC